MPDERQYPELRRILATVARGLEAAKPGGEPFTLPMQDAEALLSLSVSIYTDSAYAEGMPISQTLDRLLGVMYATLDMMRLRKVREDG